MKTNKELQNILDMVHKSSLPHLEKAIAKIHDGIIEIKILTGLDYEVTLKDNKKENGEWDLK